MNPPPRSREQRVRDTLDRLEHDVDAWVATADPATGTPYLVPLSFDWDGTSLLFATPTSNPTSRNLLATGMARVGIGPTRDLVLIEGTAEGVPAEAIQAGVADSFAARAGFDPRQSPGSWHYFRIYPRQIQAWREANELKGRDLMLDGHWLEPA